MALLHVLKIPDPNLRKVALPVEEITDDIRTIIADMLETMYAEDGAGLAATQVNIQKRIVVMDLSRTSTEPQVFINPEVLERRGETQSEEGCLSVPGLWDTVTRAAWVKFTALTEKGERVEYEAEGLLSNCIQHEVDHLNGVLYIDHLSAFKRDRILKKSEKMAKQHRAL